MKLLYQAIIPAVFMLLFNGCNSFQKQVPEVAVPEDDTTAIKEKQVNLVFGIPADRYILITDHIKRNGFLSEILLGHGVTMQEIDQVVRNSDSVFDVRKIKSGNHYTLFCDTDSIARVRYLVYEHDATTSFIFSFNDSLNITPFKKDIKKVIKYSSGTIETSLWESMVGKGFHPELAGKLSEIFAWTVDFFGLQRGDSYKVFYEELSIDDKPFGIGKIYGAQFVWAGDTITAIPFLQNGKESYFDPDGKSLMKAFLKAPLRFSRISSRYSASRLHPILRIRRAHLGVDYAAPLGTPVQAIGDGRVTFAGTENGSGRMVKIVHNSVYSTAYLHLSGFGKGIYSGAFVKQGDIIGYVGSSGLATGPHLDFRFYKNGSPVDPLKVEAPPVEPVAQENMLRFEKSRMLVMSLLSTF